MEGLKLKTRWYVAAFVVLSLESIVILLASPILPLVSRNWFDKRLGVWENVQKYCDEGLAYYDWACTIFCPSRKLVSDLILDIAPVEIRMKYFE